MRLQDMKLLDIKIALLTALTSTVKRFVIVTTPSMFLSILFQGVVYGPVKDAHSWATGVASMGFTITLVIFLIEFVQLVRAIGKDDA